MLFKFAALGLLAMTVVGCEIGKVNVPETKPMVVVHAVLNPGASSQVVLLERLRTGAVTLPEQDFNPADPIVSDGGIAISGATVELVDPSGRGVRAIEDRVTIGNFTIGAGVYRTPLGAGLIVVPGGHYTLKIHTAQGEDVSAETTVPNTSAVIGRISQLFDRDRDTVVLNWKPVPQARTYAVRVESPHGAFFVFTDSTHITLNGELRNIFADEIPRLFVPGFKQQVTVTAVDSNFYDYYRTRNDPFTGSGIISRIRGGIGLFGAIVNIDLRTFDVVVDRHDPIEGRWVLQNASGGTAPIRATELQLYVESPAVREGGATTVSGNYSDESSSRTRGVWGTILGTTVELRLLDDQLIGSTNAVFIGELKGDLLTGRYSNSNATVVFAKSK